MFVLLAAADIGVVLCGIAGIAFANAGAFAQIEAPDDLVVAGTGPALRMVGSCGSSAMAIVGTAAAMMAAQSSVAILMSVYGPSCMAFPFINGMGGAAIRCDGP
jgi:hypothetical protein